MTAKASTRLFVLLLGLLLGQTAHAVLPDEVLTDPALEVRARSLSSELRCMVCQNQSIDDSDAELARDLRILVRERLTAGDSDAEVINYIVSRYGEFVLLKPRMSVRNVFLWATPLLLLVLGIVFLIRTARRARPEKTDALTREETEALDDILGTPLRRAS